MNLKTISSNGKLDQTYLTPSFHVKQFGGSKMKFKDCTLRQKLRWIREFIAEWWVIPLGFIGLTILVIIIII